MLKEAWEILLMVRTDSQHTKKEKNKRRRSKSAFRTHSKYITVLPSADSAIARQKGQLKASTVGSLPPIIDSRLTDSLTGGMCIDPGSSDLLKGGMCIDPRPRDLLMGRMRIRDSLMCRMGITPDLSDSLVGRMCLFSYATVPWQVQHFYLFIGNTTTHFNGIADCNYYFL
jgi:hypothetical protein